MSILLPFIRSVCYLCENETDLVLWMSAVNREVEKIVKRLAGVEDEPPQPVKASSAAASTGSKVMPASGSGGRLTGAV